MKDDGEYKEDVTEMHVYVILLFFVGNKSTK